MQSISNTIFIGKSLVFLKQIESTNAYAANLISKNSPINGTVVFSPNQTAGRGQPVSLGGKVVSNSWKSEANKNIACSIILEIPFIEIKHQFRLSMMTALAIKQCIDKYLPKKDVRIKWPNDIYIGDKKVAGILIENTLQQNKLKYCILGIGINVNQLSFPKDLPNPSSLALEANKEMDIQGIVEQICARIEQAYLKLKQGKVDWLKSEYVRSLYRYQEKHLYLVNEEEIEGQLLGINEFGHLQLEINNGVRSFDLKEIKFII